MQKLLLSVLSLFAVVQGISVREFKMNNKNAPARFYDSAGVSTDSMGKCNLGSPTKEGFPMELKGIDATAGVSPELYEGGMCGMCLQVKDGDETYKVFVNNECSTCKGKELNIAFDANFKSTVSWKAVPCNTGASPMAFQFANSNQYYLKIQPAVSRCAIASFEVMQDDQWKEGTLTPDNYYEFVGGKFEFPLKIKVTSIFGEEITDTLENMTNMKSAGKRGAQFSRCSLSEEERNVRKEKREVEKAKREAEAAAAVEGESKNLRA